MRVRFTCKKLASILSAILLIMLLAGCTQPAANNATQSETTVKTTVAASESSSPSPESRLAEILDPKKYANQFTIRVFNIGQKDKDGNMGAGDTILVQTPDGATMLIDTGYKETIVPVLDSLKKLGVAKLDYVVATHMHGDHVGGFPAVINAMPVETVLASRHATRSTSSAKTFISELKEKGKDFKVVKEGDTFQFGKDVKVEVLSPEDSDFEIPNDDYSNQNVVNDQSVVLKMTYGSNTFLFPGDIQMGTEQRLMEKYGEKLNVDLVKAPHHGYNTSSSSLFLKALSPAVTLIPQYTMANFDVYQRYKNAGSTVYVTGLDGMLLAVSDGKNIKVITEKDRKGNLKP